MPLATAAQSPSASATLNGCRTSCPLDSKLLCMSLAGHSSAFTICGLLLLVFDFCFSTRLA